MGIFDSREAFERDYAECTRTPLEAVVSARHGDDSYSLPKISMAYFWWKRSRANTLAGMSTALGNSVFDARPVRA